jgi:acyl carrier protein
VLDDAEIEKGVLAILGDFAGAPEAVASSDRLRDLGIDSLDLTEIVGRVDDEFGLAISGGELGRMRTVGDLVDIVSAAVRSRSA